MATATPKALAKKHLELMAEDEDRLCRIERYIRGEHDLPYMPKTADAEYRLLASEAVSNWSPLLIGTIAQALYVDGYRPGIKSRKKGNLSSGGASTASDQWAFWQRSRLDGRQSPLYRAACGFGQAFLVVEKDGRGKAKASLFSPMHSSALWRDPANDEYPYSFFTVVDYPDGKNRGVARMWDETFEYEVRFNDGENLTVRKVGEHGASTTPAVRFSPYVDLEGEVMGLVEPMIPLQDRINQTVFDLLVAQTYSSFKVRWVTGMAPPLEMETVEEDTPAGPQLVRRPKLDQNGDPIPKAMDHNAKRFLFAEDKDVSFGTLDETPLGGFIESIDMSIRHLSAIAQIPPHHLLGQIANLSAEALAAAETSLSRKIEEFRKSFGESWERVFRLQSEIEGVEGGDDYHGEVVWRDVEVHSLAQTADGLGKFAESLDIPKRGLWNRVPGVSQDELDKWEDMYEDEQSMRRAAERLVSASGRSAGRVAEPDVPAEAAVEESE